MFERVVKSLFQGPTSPGFRLRYGVRIKASGILDFWRSELVVGIAFRVDLWYDGSAFRVGDCENEACAGCNCKFSAPVPSSRRLFTLGGRLISGGMVVMSSSGFKGRLTRLIVCVS